MQLPLLNHAHSLYASDQFWRTPEGLEPQHWVGEPFHCPVVLFDEIVQVFGLPQFNIKAGIFIDAFDAGGVGATFVDGDLRKQPIQVDGALQVASCRCKVPLGSEQKIHRIACFVDYAIQILALTSHLDVGLVHAPTRSHRTLATSKRKFQDRRNSQ